MSTEPASIGMEGRNERLKLAGFDGQAGGFSRWFRRSASVELRTSSVSLRVPTGCEAKSGVGGCARIGPSCASTKTEKLGLSRGRPLAGRASPDDDGMTTCFAVRI